MIELKTLLTVIGIIGVAHLAWRFTIIKNFVPMLVLEIATGIGFSMLGKYFPGIKETLMDDKALQFIHGGTLFGVLLYMMTTGAEMIEDQEHSEGTNGNGNSWSFWVLSSTSMFCPMTLGCLSGYLLWLYFPQLRGERTMHSPFLFVFAGGLCAGITAITVMSRILFEMGLLHTRLGKYALRCATPHDFWLWALLTVLFAYLGNQHSSISPASALLLTGVFVGVMWFIVRKLLKWYLTTKDYEQLTLVEKLKFLIIISFSCGFITHWLGVHYPLGAVMLGVILPKEMREEVKKFIQPFILALLVPAFFGSAGLTVSFSLSDPGAYLVTGAMLVSMTLGHLVGTVVIAKYVAKFEWLDSFSLGSLMLCKGIVELYVGGELLKAGVISDAAYAGLAMFAIVANMGTKPLLSYLLGREAVNQLQHISATERLDVSGEAA